MHAATLEDEKLVLHELAVFVGKNFVVTIRAHPVFPLDEIERRWLAKGALPHTRRGCCTSSWTRSSTAIIPSQTRTTNAS